MIKLFLSRLVIKNQTTALRAREMHPLWCLRHHLSPKGALSYGPIISIYLPLDAYFINVKWYFHHEHTNL